MRRDPSTTNIYFLVAGELNLVKIGRTKDVTKRVNFINTSSPVELELVSVLRGVDPIQEQLIHEKFETLRRRGEWFHLNDELRAFIADPVAIRIDPENDWSTCKVFISRYEDTTEARADAVRLEESILKAYKCSDVLAGDPEWNYISAAKCVVLLSIVPEKIKILQSNPNKSYVIQECPPKVNALCALAPNDTLTDWLRDKELKSVALSELVRRSSVREKYPWIVTYAEHHAREREQLQEIICEMRMTGERDE